MKEQLTWVVPHKSIELQVTKLEGSEWRVSIVDRNNLNKKVIGTLPNTEALLATVTAMANQIINHKLKKNSIKENTKEIKKIIRQIIKENTDAISL